MSDIRDFFVSHARLSRTTLARFAEADLSEVDQAADDLGFGQLLRLDEAQEVVAELDRDQDDNEPDDETTGRDDDTQDDYDDAPEDET